MVLGLFCASFSYFIWMFSGIFLKLAALAKSSPRPHGNMVFKVLELVIFRDSFRFILGSVFESILARLGINFWSSWDQKVAKISTQIDAKIGHRKK